MKKLLVATLALGILGTGALASPENKGQQADTNHPNIHGKVGQKPAGETNKNANPNGSNANGGGIHGIANTPGQNGVNPNADGTKGFANQLNTVHGGIGDVNKNVGK